MRFVYESRIAAPPAAVFAFHQQPGAFQKITPPWAHATVAKEPPSLEIGQRAVIHVKLLGLIPRTWVAVFREYDPPHVFADEQSTGPFAKWYHRHLMTDDGQGGTILREEVEYEPPLGALGRLAAPLLIESKLRRMFAYRHDVTRRELEKPAG